MTATSPPWFPAALLLAWLVLDWAYPYHSGILLTIHPVHTAYLMAKRLHRPGASGLWGIFLATTVIITHVLPYAVLYYALITRGLLVAAAAVGVWVLKVSASLRLLLDTVKRAAQALDAGDLEKARELVQGLVRRDVSSLSPDLVMSAAIESLAESLVDGLVSPLTYYIFLGPPGALLQRIVNTLDGAVGFLHEEYVREGRASAYLDTILNYVPARYTALLIAATSLLLGEKPSRSVRCWRRFRDATKSRNAGHPMSAMAGALGVTLTKLGHYTIPCGSPPTPSDALKAVRLAETAALLHIALTGITSSLVMLFL